MRASARFRFVALGLLALAALLALPAGALAAPPEHFTDSDAFSDVPVADCGDFLVLSSATIEVHGTTFFDAAGNPVRLQVHVRFVGTVENSETGETLPDLGYLTDTIDLVSGEERTAGLIFQTTVPGVGTVVKDVGVIIFEPDGEVIIHGPHEAFEAGGYQVFCPILA